jgi:lysophospholipase L1-like esterase
MRAHLALVMSLGLSSFAGACGDPAAPTAIPHPLAKVDDNAVESGHHFGRFVAMGTSQTGGTTSGGLFAESQKHSWPAQLARLANVEFTLPLLDGFGCPAPLIAPLELQLRTNGDSRNNTTSCSSLAPGVILPTQNLAIFSVLTSEALFTTPEIAAAANAAVGVMYSRILPPGQTQVTAMQAQDPSYVAVEFGGVEVISTARLGSAIPAVSFAQWAPLYDQVIAAVKAEGARAVLVSFPNTMAMWPGLRTGAELYAERDEFAARYIIVSAGCGAAEAENLVYLPRKVFQALAAATTAKAAGAPAPILTCTNIPGTQDAVLTPTEATAANAAWALVNNYIKATATANGFAHFSINDLFTLPEFRPPFSLQALLTSGEPYGPYMGLDDLHPNAAGEHILAEAAAKALNTAYGLHIPWQRTLASVNPLRR